MVRACKVISQRLGRILTHKNGSCILDLRHDLKGVDSEDLQVFGSDLVGRINGILHSLRHKNIAVVFQRLSHDLGSGQTLHKDLNLFGNLFCQFLRGGDQDGAGQFVVFCLRQQICRHISGIGTFIRKHQYLTGTGDGINADISIDCLFRQCHEDIAGAGDLVHLRNGLRSEGHSCDRLGTAHLIDGIHARNIRSNQCARVYLAFR